MMHNIVFVWLMATVVLFMVGACGLRLFWETLKLMAVIAFGCAVFFIAGCATHTQEEIQWRRAIEAENWMMCERAYSQSGVPTIHIGHHHNRRSRSHVDASIVRSDLALNRCKMLLDTYWAEY